MEVTFAIPFYQNIEFLEKTLSSVLAQSSSRWRATIVVDGADAPNVPNMPNMIAGIDNNRIRCITNQKRLGMAGNWNRCLDLGETDLVTILHSDDELLPDYAEVMLKAAENNPEAIAFFCNAKIIGPDSRPKFSFPDFYKKLIQPAYGENGLLSLSGENGVLRLLHGNFIMCPTLCFRREKLKGRRFSLDLKMVQDMEFTTRLLLDGEVLVGLKSVSYAYRRHQNNATVAYTKNLLRFNEESSLYREIEKKARQRHWMSAAAIAHRKTVIKLNLMYCMIGDFLQLKGSDLLVKLKLLITLITE